MGSEYRQAWEKLVEAGGFLSGRFLQSWQWGEFRRALGYEIFRIGAFEGGELKGICFLEKRPVGLGQSYLYLPRGPIINPRLNPPPAKKGVLGLDAAAGGRKEGVIFQKLLAAVKQLAQSQGSFLARWDGPFELEKTANIDYFSRFLGSFGFQPLGDQVEPQYTLVVDLNRPPAQIRQSFASRVKRKINKAHRHQVAVRELGIGNKELRIFLELLRATEQRQKIDLYTQSRYFEKLFEKFSDYLRLFVAEYKAKPVAGALIVVYGNSATYFYGGSIRMKQDLGAPWLLHWEIINRMKQAGYQWYDFWGIGKKQPDGSFWPAGWQGITFFKTGFGGQKVSYLGAYDLPLRPWIYKAYKFLSNSYARH